MCKLALLALAAHAGKVTISNPEEKELQGGKRLCIYLFTSVTQSESCPYSMRFNTAANEK
ncbi:hypothetical protein EJW85_11420 [Escherichia coli]|nr:hypothetical protein [Escherichia coli]EFH8235698.1 hypothetical protein [Escherichia coli]EFH9073129.1 hypothetical protein [Escherichia coli]